MPSCLASDLARRHRATGWRPSKGNAGPRSTVYPAAMIRRISSSQGREVMRALERDVEMFVERKPLTIEDQHHDDPRRRHRSRARSIGAARTSRVATEARSSAYERQLAQLMRRHCGSRSPSPRASRTSPGCAYRRREEFMKPLIERRAGAASQGAGEPHQRHRARPSRASADTALRLARYFGTTAHSGYAPGGLQPVQGRIGGWREDRLAGAAARGVTTAPRRSSGRTACRCRCRWSARA